MYRSSTGLQIYWGKLPHWRMPGATYFVTWRIRRDVAELIPEDRQLVAQTIERSAGTKYALHAFVVMNDHVHVLLTPLADFTLEKIVRAWKSYTGRHLKRTEPKPPGIWQSEYFDRIVRNSDEFAEKAAYIFNNPWQRWPEMEAYPWIGGDALESHMGRSGDRPPRHTQGE